MLRKEMSTMTETDDIVASTEMHLQSRPYRDPDLKVEILALRRLAAAMAHRPDQVLHALCEEVMETCGAESAGISLLQDVDSDGDFYWPAVAGIWAQYEGGGMPRSASPCGVVLKRDSSLIFRDVETQFPAAAEASPRIAEILLSPFRLNGRPIGTIWAIMHSDAKRFDREDKRLLESIAEFASAAYQMAYATTDARQARAQLSLVNDELAHRLKNMLAMVMAIASQTLKDVAERDAVEAFQLRLQALGSAHDILLDQTWVAAPVRLIVERVIANLGQAGRVTISGPDVTLGPKAALSLSLILHELSTNAIKYGALASGNGRVSFGWHITEERDPQFVAHWEEQGGPAVITPTRKGFGTRLIGMGLIGRGSVELSYPVIGVQASFTAPLRLAQHDGLEEPERVRSK